MGSPPPWTVTHQPPKKSLTLQRRMQRPSRSAHINIFQQALLEEEDEAIRSRLSPVNVFRVLAAPVGGWMGR